MSKYNTGTCLEYLIVVVGCRDLGILLIVSTGPDGVWEAEGGDSIHNRVYHCDTVRIRPVADFPEFLSRIFSPRSGAGAFIPLRVQDSSVLTVTEGQEILLFLFQDELPRAVLVASKEELREFKNVVRAVLALLYPDDPDPLTLSLGRVTTPVELVPELEKNGYRAFGKGLRVQEDDVPAVILYFHDDITRTFDTLLSRLGPKGIARQLEETFGPSEGKIGSGFILTGSAAVAPPDPGITAGSDTPAVTLNIREPWAALGSRLLFPTAFSAGEVRIRFRPRSYGVIPGGFALGFQGEKGDAAAPLRWYRFSHQGGGGTVNGFWVLGAGVDEKRLTAAAEVVFRSAAAAVAGSYTEAGVSGGPWKTRFAPCSEPGTFAIPVFRVRGDLDIAHARISLDILVPEKTPAFLAALCGFSPMESGGRRGSENSDKTLEAALALDRRLAARPGALRLDSILMGEAKAGTAFAPVHELIECMSEGDRRLFVQNFLAPRFRGGDLAALLFRGRQSAAEEGSSGASPAGGSGIGKGSQRLQPLRPQATDLRSFAALLPPAVRSAFAEALREGTASAGGADFLARNDQAIAKAVEELRRGALSLGVRGAGLLEEAYLRWVYPRMRYPLDQAIAADRPFADLAKLTERQFRMTVDLSDTKTLAWAVLGRSPGETRERLTRLVKHCSRRKFQAIREEAERLTRLLEVGIIDPEQFLAERMELAGVANRVVEGELREAERRRAVRAAEGPGTRRYR